MQYRQAKDIALKITRELEPLCLHCDIAGSIRREKAEVKDIEIVVVPRITEVNDLFGNPVSKKRLNPFVAAVRSYGEILSGDVNIGRYVKILLPEKINLDLFIPVETDWARQYAIRTGSMDYSHKVLAVAWVKNGWVGTEDGLRRMSESYSKVVGKDSRGKDKLKWFCNKPSPTLPPVWDNEWELFNWLGIRWIEPKNRNV